MTDSQRNTESDVQGRPDPRAGIPEPRDEKHSDRKPPRPDGRSDGIVDPMHSTEIPKATRRFVDGTGAPTSAAGRFAEGTGAPVGAAGRFAEGTHGGARPVGAEAVVGPWLGQKEVQGVREEWTGVQADFVDDPARAVAAAGELVERTAELTAEAVRLRLSKLRDGSRQGADGTDDDAARTEHLRLAMREYRAVLDRLAG
ncbi:hypothetical protein ACIRPK_00010 [Kitasatospora sp. NPDC101801]|uniref:hypothetical protein n=1 Tax=Kitasatospora sp. NPDC101801 TaxID=3364103 RepID=UPI00381D8FB7